MEVNSPFVEDKSHQTHTCGECKRFDGMGCYYNFFTNSPRRNLRWEFHKSEEQACSEFIQKKQEEVDKQPTEQKKTEDADKWKEHHVCGKLYGKIYYQHDCSPELYESPYNYCPRCGKKMKSDS